MGPGQCRSQQHSGYCRGFDFYWIFITEGNVDDGSRDDQQEKLKQLLHSHSRSHLLTGQPQTKPAPSTAGAVARLHLTSLSKAVRIVVQPLLRRASRFGFQHKDPTCKAHSDP